MLDDPEFDFRFCADTLEGILMDLATALVDTRFQDKAKRHLHLSVYLCTEITAQS